MKSKIVADLSEFATPEEREAIDYDTNALARLRRMLVTDRTRQMISEMEYSLGSLVSEIRSRVPKEESLRKGMCGCGSKKFSRDGNKKNQKKENSHIHVCKCVPGCGEPLNPHNVRVGINRLREQGREDDANDLESAFQEWLQGDTSKGGLIRVLLNEYLPALGSGFSYDVDKHGIVVSIH